MNIYAIVFSRLFFPLLHFIVKTLKFYCSKLGSQVADVRLVFYDLIFPSNPYCFVCLSIESEFWNLFPILSIIFDFFRKILFRLIIPVNWTLRIFSDEKTNSKQLILTSNPPCLSIRFVRKTNKTRTRSWGNINSPQHCTIDHLT